MRSNFQRELEDYNQMIPNVDRRVHEVQNYKQMAQDHEKLASTDKNPSHLIKAAGYFKKITYYESAAFCLSNAAILIENQSVNKTDAIPFWRAAAETHMKSQRRTYNNELRYYFYRIAQIAKDPHCWLDLANHDIKNNDFIKAASSYSSAAKAQIKKYPEDRNKATEYWKQSIECFTRNKESQTRDEEIIYCISKITELSETFQEWKNLAEYFTQAGNFHFAAYSYAGMADTIKRDNPNNTQEIALYLKWAAFYYRSNNDHLHTIYCLKNICELNNKYEDWKYLADYSEKANYRAITLTCYKNLQSLAEKSEKINIRKKITELEDFLKWDKIKEAKPIQQRNHQSVYPNHSTYFSPKRKWEDVHQHQEQQQKQNKRRCL